MWLALRLADYLENILYEKVVSLDATFFCLSKGGI